MEINFSRSKIIYKERSKSLFNKVMRLLLLQISKKPDELKNYLNESQFKLYDLIWEKNHCIANGIKFKLGNYLLSIKGEEILLKAGGSIEKFKGFKSVYNYQEKNENEQKLLQI